MVPYITAVLAFVLYYATHKRLPNRLRRIRYIEFIPFFLLAIGTSTLAATTLGDRLAAWFLGAPLGWLGQLIGVIPTVPAVTGAVVATVALVAIVVLAVFDLLDLRPDGIAKTAVIVGPFLALVAIGPVAGGASGVFDAVAGAGANALPALVWWD